jgi:quinol monooxygenase YgiN
VSDQSSSLRGTRSELNRLAIVVPRGVAASRRRGVAASRSPSPWRDFWATGTPSLEWHRDGRRQRIRTSDGAAGWTADAGRRATMNQRDEVMTHQERESDLWTITRPGVPLFMNVTLTIKPERRESFLAALRDILPAARAEPICIYLHVGQSVTEPDVFVLSEGWTDLVEYRDVVLRKPYFQTYLRISEDAYARPRVVLPLIPVEPDL